MSSTSPHRTPLPSAWVDRIFARFFAAFGAVKLAAMWPEESHDAVKAAWGDQLGRFHPETIRAALQEVVDAGSEWPPTLPEFVERCRKCALGRAAHAPANLLPRPAVADEVVAENLRRVNEALAGVSAGGKPSRVWADRIIARSNSGDTVPLAVLEMARRAQRAKAEPA